MDVREKLFTLFQDCNNPSWKWFPNNAEMLKLIDYLIAHGVTVQEWISVKDRLPKPYTRVIVRVNGYKDILVGWYTETFKDSNNEKFDCWCIEYKLSERSMEPVTHWMPMPQPPKGE